MQISMKRRMAWPLVGAVSVVAGWAPVSQAAPSMDAKDAGLKAPSADPGDGTYESCAAYFGFGKDSGALDVVAFDVTDQNGSDGATHAIGDDTQVIFQLTNGEGDTLECEAPEITEADWQAGMDSIYLSIPEDRELPSYPGPGHYAYPTVSYEPFIEADGFGTVTAVAFQVTSVPEGHTLVSPTGFQPLVQHYPIGEVGNSTIVDPRVLAYIDAEAGPAASQAFEAALGDCPDGEFGPDLIAAIEVLEEYYGWAIDDPYCGWIEQLNASTSFLLALNATAVYVEPIVLALPEEPTTTPSTTIPSTTSTTVDIDSTTAVPPATPSQPVAGTPAYTG